MPSLPRKNPEANSAERIEASGGWWPRPESNQRHTDFQSAALPTELLGRGRCVRKPERAEKESANYTGRREKKPASRAGFRAPVGARLSTQKLGSGFLRFPDTHLARFRHEEEAKHEAHRRYRNRIDQRVAEAARGLKGGGSDERYQPAAPAVADVIRDGHRRVADPAGKVFSQERPDRPVHHAHVGHENENDEDRDGIVDGARLGDRSQPRIQRIVGDGREQEAP